MSEQVGRQSEGVEPIAWVRGNGNVVQQRWHGQGVGDGIGYVEFTTTFQFAGTYDDLPSDAVPLVPATDVEEARKIAEWLLAKQAFEYGVLVRKQAQDLERAERRARDFEGRYESAHASRMHAESVVFRLEVEVERLKAAPQLPAVDTPEALRYAADVVKNHADRREVDAERARSLEVLAALRGDADRLEAAARADAEREARIEAVTDIVLESLERLATMTGVSTPEETP